MVLIIRADAWPRFKALASKIPGWRKERALQAMCDLWMNTQGLGIWEASSAELATMAEVDVDPTIFINAALYARFITFLQEDLYLIRGNKAELTNIERRQSQRRDAANKRWDDYRARMAAEAEAESGEDGPDPDALPINAAAPAMRVACEPHKRRMRAALPPQSGSNAECMPKLHQAKRTQAKRTKLTTGERARARTGAGAPPPALPAAPGDQGNGSGTPPAGAAADAAASSPPQRTAPPEEDLARARLLRNCILRHNTAAVGPKKASMNTWAGIFTAMRIVDGLAGEVIDTGIEALYNSEHWGYVVDPFERNQITSAADFRRRWDKLSAQINNPKGQKNGFVPRDSQGRPIG